MLLCQRNIVIWLGVQSWGGVMAIDMGAQLGTVSTTITSQETGETHPQVPLILTKYCRNSEVVIHYVEQKWKERFRLPKCFEITMKRSDIQKYGVKLATSIAIGLSPVSKNLQLEWCEDRRAMTGEWDNDDAVLVWLQLVQTIVYLLSVWLLCKIWFIGDCLNSGLSWQMLVSLSSAYN